LRYTFLFFLLLIYYLLAIPHSSSSSSIHQDSIWRSIDQSFTSSVDHCSFTHFFRREVLVLDFLLNVRLSDLLKFISLLKLPSFNCRHYFFVPNTLRVCVSKSLPFLFVWDSKTNSSPL
jgi:hypothetical protein